MVADGSGRRCFGASAGEVFSGEGSLFDGAATYFVEAAFEGNLQVTRLKGIFCGSRVIGAEVQFKLVVALLLVVRFHVVKRFANERPGRAECPGTFGACPALKILFLDPYQFATSCLHEHLEF